MCVGGVLLFYIVNNMCDIIVHIVFMIQMQNWSLCEAPSFERLAGAE